MTIGSYAQRGKRLYRVGHRIAVIGVSAATYSKALKLRDTLGLATLGDVVDLVTKRLNDQAPVRP